jgi:hypothetical protein
VRNEIFCFIWNLIIQYQLLNKRRKGKNNLKQMEKGVAMETTEWATCFSAGQFCCLFRVTPRWLMKDYAVPLSKFDCLNQGQFHLLRNLILALIYHFSSFDLKIYPLNVKHFIKYVVKTSSPTHLGSHLF